jgi:Ser/Thr protein kinase RdoA (MazF antagonist)
MAVIGDTLKAHGLQGSLEEADWPPLTLPEVDSLLRRYPQAGGAERLLSRSPRPFSAASVVATPAGAVFVKRHARAIRDREGLLEEHRLIAALAVEMEGEVSRSSESSRVSPGLVQAVLADRDGETAVAEGEWTYEVHPLARGVDVYEQALSWTPFLGSGHARAAGQAMAKLHRAAAGYQGPARKAQQLVTSFTIFARPDLEDLSGSYKSDDGPFRRMDAYLDRRPMLRDYAEVRDWRSSFEELFMPLYRDLDPWLVYLRPLWTHNDFHASNLTWTISGSGDDEVVEVAGIIDFGLADRTNAVHDLATAIERNVVEWLRIAEPEAHLVHLDHLDALLAGYEQLSPLSYEEARALVAMLPLVHCEFALSEADYFLSILNSREKATLAYEGYFVAHARWYGSTQGRALLERMERWAEDRPRARGGDLEWRT